MFWLPVIIFISGAIVQIFALSQPVANRNVLFIGSFIAIVGLCLTVFTIRKLTAKQPDEHTMQLQTYGIRTTAVITHIEETEKKEGMYPIVQITVEIALPEKHVYSSSIEVPVSYRAFPAVGQSVKILVNPENHQDFIFGQ